MGKANRKGRSEPGFILLHRGVTQSAAWKALTCEARCLLLEVWERHNGKNNGEIGLSWRQAREALGIGQSKVKKALAQLEETGFLVARQRGSFDWKGNGRNSRSTRWEITTEACNGSPARRLYKEWKAQNAATAPVSKQARMGTASVPKSLQNSANGYCPGTHNPPNAGSHGYQRGSGYISHRGARILRRVFVRSERHGKRVA